MIGIVEVMWMALVSAIRWVVIFCLIMTDVGLVVMIAWLIIYIHKYYKKL